MPNVFTDYGTHSDEAQPWYLPSVSPQVEYDHDLETYPSFAAWLVYSNNVTWYSYVVLPQPDNLRR